MKILFNVSHPAHVHLFRNAIKILKDRGHEIKATSVDKEITAYLLNAYGIEHEPVGRYKKGLIGQAFETLTIERNLYKISKNFKTDILIGGVGNIYVAHVAKLVNKPSVIFDDTEHAKLEHFLLDPFVTIICTPSCFKKDLGRRQFRYNGYHEIAYLHPNYFKPNPGVLDELNLSKQDKFVILRFISWDAAHDIGQKGFDPESKIKMVKELEKYANVFITSESKLNKNLEKYKITVSPEKMHDLLYYATMYVGEGGTTSTEAAILGTPSLLLNTEAKYCGIHNELMEKYGLQFYYEDQKELLQEALRLLNIKDIKLQWKNKKEKLLKDKIDTSEFMVNFIETFGGK